MFPLKQTVRNTGRMLLTYQPMSSTPLVDVADHDGIAILTLKRPPINCLNLELLQAINKSLDEVANNKPRGMILTSASPRVFSAGLDVLEMYKPEKKRVELFWSTFQDTWLKLFGFKFATAAAINGYAPAGGCLLAMSCEYRAMVAGKYTMGLNETALGLVAPQWFVDTMCHIIPTRDAELALTSSTLFTADKALKIGLFDEIAVDKADAIEKCKKFIQKFDEIPPLVRTESKLKIRQEHIKKLQENRQRDMADFLQNINDPKVQKGLETYIHKKSKRISSE